jgi:signal transduction histidine kinase/DNA-binding response OmpR family regulator
MKLSLPEFAYIFLGGFYISMAALHLILYTYNRHRKMNLFYGLGLVVASVNYTFVDLSVDPGYSQTDEKANILLSTVSNGILLYFAVYYIVATNQPELKKFIQYFAWPYLAGLIALIVLPYSSVIFSVTETILRTTCYIAAIVIVVYGFVKRTPNFYLIMLATLGLILTEIFLAADVLNLWSEVNLYPPSRSVLIVIGYTTPFLAYSAYLSKDLALTSKKLMKEHVMNERLSREKYEQETVTRKLLEVQNIELERSVIERTRQISAQKEELETQADKIMELDKIKSRFFANISHEFRTPLSLILGPLEKKLAQPSMEDRREVEVMHRSAARLLTLVNQLLDLSKLEDGSLTLRASEQDLSKVVSIIASQFASMAEARGIHFAVNSTQCILAFVDTDKLTKVISNLLSNAFKFTPSSGYITILVKKGEPDLKYTEGYAEILVTDTGIGIEEEHLPKIFNRFYQVDNSVTRDYEGSGIGLSLTKELVELHHGDISATSQPGCGSSFVVRLPLGKSFLGPKEIDTLLVNKDQFSSLESPELNSNELMEHNGAGRLNHKILLVEDNADMRYYLREGLKEQYTILEAADGKEGLMVAMTEIPDLIVSDLMMPRLDGKSLCEKLKIDEMTSHIPLILLTAKADVNAKIEGFQAGADDYISKPFHTDELRARIKNLIEGRKKLQEKFSRHLTLGPQEIQVTSLEEKFIHKVVSIIEKNMGEPSFCVENLSREAAMSSVQLYRKLKAVTGSTPNELIRSMRLDRASSLLRQRGGNVAEVAYQVGFSNLSYFSKCFREKFGHTPSEV